MEFMLNLCASQVGVRSVSVRDANNSMQRSKGAANSVDDLRKDGLATQHTLPVSLVSAPSFNLLQSSERELCSEMQILPKAYLIIKQAILAEGMRVLLQPLQPGILQSLMPQVNIDILQAVHSLLQKLYSKPSNTTIPDAPA